MSDWPPAFDRILRGYCRFVVDGRPIAGDEPLTQLGVDSLGMLGLIVELEDEFDIEMPFEMVTPEVLATPATLWTAVCELVSTTSEGVR